MLLQWVWYNESWADVSRISSWSSLACQSTLLGVSIIQRVKPRVTVYIQCMKPGRGRDYMYLTVIEYLYMNGNEFA